MKNNTGLLVLLILLVLTNSSFAQQNTRLAPEATVAETKLSFWKLPHLKKAFINVTPVVGKDGLPVGKLGADGGNKAMILKLAQEIANNKHGKYDGLLISYKNKLIFESYYKRGRINLPHFQSSAAKVYTTLALGRAIQLGYLTMADLDKPLVNFLKDLNPAKFVKGAETITLHKALTMRSGLRVSREKRKELAKNPAQLKGQRQVQAWLQYSKPITEESQIFKYQDDPVLVMQVIEAVVPGTAKDFIKKELLDKMGITNYRWKDAISGLPEISFQVDMTSRDMIKWGKLVLNKGKWNGEQLISKAFIAKATSGITLPTENWQPKTYRYGYYWYQTNIIVGGKSYKANLAWGGGGQHIIVIEALDLIIAITGHDIEDKIMTQVSKNIVPAFTKDRFLPLKDRYLGQKPVGLTPKPFAPGMVSTERYQYSGTFTPDMREFYFIRGDKENKKQEFVVYQYKNNRWQASVVSRRVGQSMISPDGKTMHLGRRYKERTKTGWSEVKTLEPSLKNGKGQFIMRLTSSLNGTYYFDTYDKSNEAFPIRYSRLIDGKYEKPRALSNAINTGVQLNHPFIAPDESYLLWDAQKEGGHGDSDIYISFRQKDGSWGAAINLGDKVNTSGWDAAASVTPDGKYLLFHRTVSEGSKDTLPNVNIFWVDAQIIEKLRPKK